MLSCKSKAFTVQEILGGSSRPQVCKISKKYGLGRVKAEILTYDIYSELLYSRTLYYSLEVKFNSIQFILFK